MLFNSFSFLIFFPIVVLIYYSISHKARPILLLLASCIFYMAFVPKYILILFFLITVDYFLAKEIEKREGRDRKIFLILSIIANIGTLFIFKYFNFFNQNVADLASFLGWNYSMSFLKIALPIGLSFHVFQSLSYVIEVYRKKFSAENNYLTYALYVMFFPQLVAGPIERPGHLLPQFKLEHNFNALNIRRGLERMLWGFFKKLVIADNIAIIVDRLYYNLPTEGTALILIVILFAYQLYCDFSGYSDIALGSAQVLGYNLSENFNRPYATRSIAEFWRCWHISLSNWLRDYLYYPLALGWGRVSKVRLYFSLFITFVIIGLWHGANWTFVVMGAIHGIYLVFGSITQNLRRKIVDIIGLSKLPKVHHAIQVVCVFILVSISWTFFRAENLAEAWNIVSNLGNNLTDLFSVDYILHGLFRGLHLGKYTPTIILCGIIILEIVQYYQAKMKTLFIFENRPKIVRYSWYYGLILIILFFGYIGSQTFIYFQF